MWVDEGVDVGLKTLQLGELCLGGCCCCIVRCLKVTDPVREDTAKAAVSAACIVSNAHDRSAIGDVQQLLDVFMVSIDCPDASSVKKLLFEL